MDMILWMLAALVGYFIKGVAGIGNTLVITSAMSYTRTNAEITPVELLLCTVPNMVLAWVNRQAINWKLVIPPLLMVLAGDVVGVFLLKTVDVTVMKTVFGVVLILLSVEQLWRELRGKPAQQAHPAVMLALGVSAGVLCGLFSVGALLAAYFARATTDDATYKGSMSVIFAVENIFRVAAYACTGLLTLTTLKTTAILLPFMGVGLFLGIKVSGRLNARLMRIIIGVLLLASGLPLVLTSL